MASVLTGIKRQNPELEAIREKILAEKDPWDIEGVISNLISKTARIHAGYLFEERPILQKLCLYVCESKNSIHDSGWERFGIELGLTQPLLKCMKYNNLNQEDPAYNVLLAYVQYEDATIGKIIQALQNIGRLDVITRIQQYVQELADTIASKYNIDITSDYGSMDSTEETRGESMELNIEIKDIIRPQFIPPAPLIYQNLEKLYDGENLVSNEEKPISTNIVSCAMEERSSMFTRFETMQYVHQSSDIMSTEVPTKKPAKRLNNEKQVQYGKKVLLTFASDAEKIAREIATIFRRKREDLPRMGVVLLSDHIQLVNKNPQEFIAGAFHQVDYVIPILSEEYFKIISRKTTSSVTSMSSVDHKYVQFIFSLMNTHYIENGCINNKVRCIIPDHKVTQLQNNLLMTGPLFTAWVYSHEAEELAVKILKSHY